MAEDDLGRERHNRDSCYLADIRYGSGRTRVYFNDVNILAINDELDVDHTFDMKCSGKLLGVIHDRLLIVLGNALCRIYGDTVTGMDTGTLNVLHDTRDQDVGAVADSVHLDLLAHDVFIDQDRVFLGDPVDDADKFIDIFVTDRNLHALSAKNVGRADEYRVT